MSNQYVTLRDGSGNELYKHEKDTSSQDLSSAALSKTFTDTVDFEALAILLHASVAITETITITYDSSTGANYDVLLKTQALTGATDYAYKIDIPLTILVGDGLKVTCTNDGSTGIVYITLIKRTV